MPVRDFSRLTAQIEGLSPVHRIGRVHRVGRGEITVSGLAGLARIGDLARIVPRQGPAVGAEVTHLDGADATFVVEGNGAGIALGDRVALSGPATISPAADWLGRIIDPLGNPLDDRPLVPGAVARPLESVPPVPSQRRALGPRLETGVPVFNTFLPLARGQRIGLFSGSGVGKSTLLGQLARGASADVVVVSLVGERGRELRGFVEGALGPEGLARAVVVVATSDRPALERRRCALSAMAIAEHFRDAGQHVLLLMDSLTRFAEAHREAAVAGGEPASLRGHPASMAHRLMSLCERAGTGGGGAGDITAVFTVLVAGSDMEEPVADVARGVLDGHVVLDRAIAERGRFPAIDLLRSVSRSLPDTATGEENECMSEARRLMGAYDRAETMIRAGLYQQGSDQIIDRAIATTPALDSFLALSGPLNIAESFKALRECLKEHSGPPGSRDSALGVTSGTVG